jgi:DNA-binding CsgD family transcriptional regulator
VSVETVKWHRTNLMRKLEARNITHAVAIGYAEGWLR